jgi:putative transposase
MERALKDGFDRSQPLKQIPTFKKRRERDSFTFPQGFKIEGKRIFLPKIGWVNFRKSRDIVGTPKNVTISRLGEHWFVSIQVEIEMPEPSHPSQSMVGIDMGVKRLFTLSTGDFEEPIDSRKWRDKIRRLQKRMAKKVKFSKNWHKLSKKINLLHTKLSNIRRNVLHKFSSVLSKSHALIAVLNQAILDQGWGMFKTFLEYKQKWLGGRVIYVDPKHTSQTCPVCHNVSKDNRKTQEAFACMRCGHLDHADMVGTKNILERGAPLVSLWRELGYQTQ